MTDNEPVLPLRVKEIHWDIPGCEIYEMDGIDLTSTKIPVV